MGGVQYLTVTNGIVYLVTGKAVGILISDNRIDMVGSLKLRTHQIKTLTFE